MALALAGCGWMLPALAGVVRRLTEINSRIAAVTRK
jgi:hypothetical protein